MNTRLRHLWQTLTSSYWFVPTLMSVAAVLLACGTLVLDRRVEPARDGGPRWVYAGGVEGARSLLSVVAGSIITTAGVVFSITIVTLNQASMQFGPRLLRNFMRDTGNQVVLGTFVATFVYCMLILRTIHGTEDAGYVPHISVTIATGMALASLGVLVYFIHHVSRSIQAPEVVARVSEDLDDAIAHMFPEDLGHPPANVTPPTDRRHATPARPGTVEDVPVPKGPQRAVPALRSGYVQAVDADALMAICTGSDLVVRLLQRPGEFVIAGNALVLAQPAERVTDAVVESLAEAYIIGNARTPEQDVEFAIAQMVEIAVRALSPAINDPITAETCLDWLGAALAQLAEQDEHSPYRYDVAGKLRVVADISTYAGIVDTAFNRIRQYGHNSPGVMIRLLETITAIAPRLINDRQRKPLLRQAAMAHRQAMSAIHEPLDCADLTDRYEAAVRALGGTSGEAAGEEAAEVQKATVAVPGAHGADSNGSGATSVPSNPGFPSAHPTSGR